MKIVRRHFETIDSTNTWAKLHVDEFPKDKVTLVTADMQTSGRGRFKRRWESPCKQNILATFCFFIDKNRRDIGNIPQVLAITTANVLQNLKFKPELKWPNDVLLSQKKVAGILAETTFASECSDLLCMIIGIGININMPKVDLEKIDRPASSLLVESGNEFNVEEVLKTLQEAFLGDLELFLMQGFTPFLKLYLNYFPKERNKIIRFHDNLAVWEGTFHAINDDGSLVLKLKNGKIKTFVAGEILWPGE